MVDCRLSPVKRLVGKGDMRYGFTEVRKVGSLKPFIVAAELLVVSGCVGIVAQSSSQQSTAIPLNKLEMQHPSQCENGTGHI